MGCHRKHRGKIPKVQIIMQSCKNVCKKEPTSQPQNHSLSNCNAIVPVGNNKSANLLALME